MRDDHHLHAAAQLGVLAAVLLKLVVDQGQKLRGGPRIALLDRR